MAQRRVTRPRISLNREMTCILQQLMDWQGEWQMVFPFRPKDWENKKDFFLSPLNSLIGIFWRKQTLVFDASIDVDWTVALHELAHIFGWNDIPTRSNELALVGWEWCMLKKLGLPARKWQSDNFNLFADPPSLLVPAKFRTEDLIEEDEKFEKLASKNKHKAIIDYYVVKARTAGIVDKKMNPINMRSAECLSCQ